MTPGYASQYYRGGRPINSAVAFAMSPMALLAVGAIGLVVCRLFGVEAHLRDLALAAIICMASSTIGLIPVLFNVLPGTQTDPAVRFQSAWLGTILHLSLAAVASIVVILLIKPGNPFVYWLLAMFWTTLISLSVVLIRVLRSPGISISNSAH